MQEEKIYKHRLKITKNKELRFISHLDWQNLILKIFRRCELKLVLSEGFNKMPKVSYSPALPIFIESDCELVNFQTYQLVALLRTLKASKTGKLLSLENIKKIFFASATQHLIRKVLSFV